MAEVGDPDIRMGRRDRPPDLAVARLAERQHGVVARRQLLTLGLTATMIQRRLESGRLHRVHRGVYAVGHRRLPVHGRWLGAVMACGSQALLSHRTAAELWTLLPQRGPAVHVSTPGRLRAGPQGVLHHRPRSLPDEDRARVAGVPVTSVARTLADLAGMARHRELRRAFEEADRLRALDLAAIERVIAGSRGKRGIAALSALFRGRAGPPPATRSELERRFLCLCLDAGLPSPRVNALVAGLEVDTVWEEARLVVELDGREFHDTAAGFERDRERDAALLLAGYRVLRITHRRLERCPAAVTATVRRLLSRSPERPAGAPGAAARAPRAAPAG